MNNEFFDALLALVKEKGIPLEDMTGKIKAAIINAVKRDHDGCENVIVEIDPEKRSFYVAIRKEVVEDVEDIANQISVEDARKISSRAAAGGFVDMKLETKQFGRIAAQNAKQVIKQGIRETERSQMLQEFQSREHEIVSAVVQRVDAKTGNATLEIGKAVEILPKSEQVPGETLKEGDRIRVYVVEVKDGDKGPKAMISRTHPGLVKRLFEREVPEIFEGVVEIKSISREAGSRTKIAVLSKDPDVDPIGSCIGPKGTRVGNIVNELYGEKIDIIKYSDNPEEFITEALSPAKVLSVEIDETVPKSCRVMVPENQLSLAIGNKGQNARLAAKLTGWKIDIKSESSN